MTWLQSPIMHQKSSQQAPESRRLTRQEKRSKTTKTRVERDRELVASRSSPSAESNCSCKRASGSKLELELNRLEKHEQVRLDTSGGGGRQVNDELNMNGIMRLPTSLNHEQVAASCRQKRGPPARGSNSLLATLSSQPISSSAQDAQLTQARQVCQVLQTNSCLNQAAQTNSSSISNNTSKQTRMKMAAKMVRRDEIIISDGKKGETSQVDAPSECPSASQTSKVVTSPVVPLAEAGHQNHYSTSTKTSTHKHQMQSSLSPSPSQYLSSTLKRRLRGLKNSRLEACRPMISSSHQFHLRRQWFNSPSICSLSSLFVNCSLVALILLLLLNHNQGGSSTLNGKVEAASGARQYFKDQPEAQYLVTIGLDVTFPCLVSNRQGECGWLHNNRIIGSIPKKYSFARLPENGDCSLTIRNASNSLDDGVWQCQVTSVDLDQDILQSRDANLIVLVPPEKPQIKNLSQGSKLILEESKQKIVTCEMRGGNPAPQIEWFLDGKNVTKDAQITSTYGGGQQGTSPTTNLASRIIQSKLKMADIRRSMTGKNLTCVGRHQTINQSTQVELDIQYVPTVSVVQREYSIVEGSPLHIACQVDSNPPATLINWRLVNDGSQAAVSRNRSPTAATMGSDREAIVSNQKGGQLNFEQISREYNQNVFECLAQNALGVSTPAEVKLNVLYAPFLLNTSHSESVNVGTEARLECVFDGNPAPEIKWFYTDPLSRTATAMQIDQTNLLLGQSTNGLSSSHNNNNRQQLQQLLLIRNVTYRNEGDYHCEAHNAINGKDYSIRSANIGLDIYGEPQILVKSPLHAKAVQGSKSDISLTFCSDPQPTKVYWQFGSIRLDVRLNFTNNNGHHLAPLTPPGGGVGRHSGQPSSVSERFLVHPLQPLQKRESSFSKVPTCFEAQLSLLNPELNDQRDYTLVVQNERSSASGLVRLRVTSPLSPALMITSAFVFICGLFLCSLLFLFILKKRQQLLASGGSATANSQSNGTNGSLASAKGQHSRRSANGGGRATKNGVPKDLALVVGGVGGKQQEPNGVQQQQNGGGGGLLKMAPGGQHQTSGIVNGLGSGLANGACNSLGRHGQLTLNEEQAAAKQTSAGLHLMSMASSDTSCNDQRQLLANSCGSDRNSSVSSSGGSGGGANIGLDHTDYKRQSDRRRRGGANGSNRSTANSTPTTPMNHISVDDELHLNGSYQATESVTLGAQLSPGHLDMNQVVGGGSGANGGALIYANIDYGSAAAAVASGALTTRRDSNDNSQPDTDLGDSGSNDSLNLINNHHMAVDHHNHPHQAGMGGEDNTTRSLVRSKVGATIAMMNSLAAAAATSATPQQQLINNGALSDAINQQLAANSTRQSRRPGPPKPPKPSIQLRSRFYQQVQQANNGVGGPGGDLVMINGAGSDLGHAAPTGTTINSGSAVPASSPRPQQQMPSSTVEQQHHSNQNHGHHNQTTAMGHGDDLAAQYSRFSFPARAEL